MGWEQYTKTAEATSGGDWPEIPDDLYEATIIDVSEPETGADKFNPGKMRTQFHVVWELDSADLPEGTTRWQYVALPEKYLEDGFLSEKSNLYQLMDALGFDLSGQFEVDPPSWIGMKARVMVENKIGDDGKPGAPRITDVKAPRAKKAAPAPVKAAPRQAVAAGRRPAGSDFEDVD